MIQPFDPEKIERGKYIRISAISPKEILSDGFRYAVIINRWREKSDRFKKDEWFSGIMIDGSYITFYFRQITEGKVTFNGQIFSPDCTYLLEHCELSDMPFWTRIKMKNREKKRS